MAKGLWPSHLNADEGIGLVIQAVGGICSVYTPAGDTLSCRIRGRIKQDGVRILPGDYVRIEPVAAGEGVIEEILPRRSELQRPYIANADQVAVVIAAAEPAPIPELIDRIVVAAIGLSMEPLLIWNKTDLVSNSRLDELMAPYKPTRFPMVAVSTKTDKGLHNLRAGLRGHLTVLAGPSGAGKSSILNWLLGENRLAIGEVSGRLQRGRHTTRAVQLISMDGEAWIADTPGFSVLDLSHTPFAHITNAYPEMDALAARCRFSGCTHRNEPECQVRKGVERGEVHQQRYETYVRLWNELETYEATKYS